jgi:hypothetical protein
MNEDILVLKLNTAGKETWRYPGRVIERHPTWLKLEAFFNRDDMPFHGITFARGDRFIETYYSDRWYNIYEIHDRTTGELKGWYCNVTTPARIEKDQVSYVDLALDLLVFPDKSRLVLDEDEFQGLNIDAATRSQARAALAELQALFR